MKISINHHKIKTGRILLAWLLASFPVSGFATEYVPYEHAPEMLARDRMTLIAAEDETGLGVVVPGILYRKTFEGEWLRATVTLYRGGPDIHGQTTLEKRPDQDTMTLVKKGNIELVDNTGTRLVLSEGDTYFVPAGIETGLRIKSKSDVILVSVRNVRTVGRTTEQLNPYNSYRAARIITVPIEHISQLRLRDMHVEVPGKVLRRVWRMRYLDGWTFSCPSGCQAGFPEHAHLADEFVFNYVGVSRMWSHDNHSIDVNELQSFFTPFGSSHRGRLISDGELLIMSIFSPHREMAAGPIQRGE